MCCCIHWCYSLFGTCGRPLAHGRLVDCRAGVSVAPRLSLSLARCVIYFCLFYIIISLSFVVPIYFTPPVSVVFFFFFFLIFCVASGWIFWFRHHQIFVHFSESRTIFVVVALVLMCPLWFFCWLVLFCACLLWTQNFARVLLMCVAQDELCYFFCVNHHLHFNRMKKKRSWYCIRVFCVLYCVCVCVLCASATAIGPVLMNELNG